MTDWRRNAACVGSDPDLFAPVSEVGPGRAQVAEAKAICRHCPVTTQCLTEALRTGDDWTIRGGTTVSERRSLRRTRTANRPRPALPCPPGPSRAPAA